MRIKISSVALVFSLSSTFPLFVSCSANDEVQLSSPMKSQATPLWVVSWGNSPENALATTENPGGQEQSFRFFFLPTVSGTQERVHFSNYFGTTPITIGAARLAVAPGGSAAIDPTHDAPLTFNGSKSITIQPGQAVVSDTVNIAYTFGQKMAVSMYVVGNFPPLTQHESQVTVNYATPPGAGDTTADSTGASFTQSNTEWYLLSGMDVFGPYQGTVVMFGSSSIDGHNSNFGNTFSYPTMNVPVPSQDNDRPSDWLARELNAAGYNLGVLNAGVLGDPAGPSQIATPAKGIASGVERMNRDVLQQPNVKAVIVYFGSLDLRSIDCKNATDVEGYLTNIIGQADAVGVRVILTTLPPTTYCANTASPNFGPVPTPTAPFAGDLNPGPENPANTQRRLVNDWIRNVAPTIPGVVVIADFDKVLLDPDHPDFILPSLNSGDNFHPTGEGYGIQSSAIPLKAILNQ